MPERKIKARNVLVVCPLCYLRVTVQANELLSRHQPRYGEGPNGLCLASGKTLRAVVHQFGAARRARRTRR